MTFLKRLFARQPDEQAMYIYARCGRCGTVVQSRIDLTHDLSQDFDAGGYFVRKGLVDARCFQRMEIELRFDRRRRVVAQQIQGGKFVSRDEWEAARNGADNT
nr:hypothetical protein [Ardenticatena sp.]